MLKNVHSLNIFFPKQKEQHIMLQNILILNIVFMQKEQQMMLQNIQDFVHIDDGFGCVLFLIALMYTGGCHVNFTNLVMIVETPFDCVGVRGFLFVNTVCQ